MKNLLIGFGLMLLFEGLGPLLFPRLWQRVLRQIGEWPAASLHRLGGALVVSGLVILWMVMRE